MKISVAVAAAAVWLAALGWAPAAAAEPLTVPGHALTPSSGPHQLGYDNSTWNIPLAVFEGVTLLDQRLTTHSGTQVTCTSEGSLVCDAWMALHPQNTTNSSFTIVAPLARPGGLLYAAVPLLAVVAPPSSSYPTKVIIQQYDGWADWPTLWPVNPLADANAVAGMVFAHPNTPSTTHGTTQIGPSTYLAPTAQLPITQPLRLAGVPDSTVDQLDSVLRPVIDSAYIRTAPVIGSASPTLATTTHKKADHPKKKKKHPGGKKK